MAKTKEPQYASFLDLRDKKGMARFGLMSNQVWHDDPRRITFYLSRYKFVAKMLSGKERVLEVGCGDGFASRIVRQEVRHLTIVDFDPIFIEDAKDNMEERWPMEFKVHDMLDGPVDGEFDAAYCVDVLEHIAPENERVFIQNLCTSLTSDAALIVGIPSLESQDFASPISREGHVNCKKAPDLKALLLGYFDNVFIFSMNDEVVHTGFTPLAHYIFALCCGKKSNAQMPNT